MKKSDKRTRTKKRGKYQKKLSLYGLKFEGVVEAVLKYRPKKKRS